MSSKNRFRFRHTLVFRLTLWYAGIFTLSSCVAFLFFYLLITSVLRDQTDQDLLNQAGKFSNLLALKGIDAVKQAAVLEAQAAGERKIFFRLLSPGGAVFSSSNMSYWRDINVARSAIQALLQGKRFVFDTIVIPDRAYKVRILYGFLGPWNRRSIILQLGQSMESYTRFIRAFQKIFVVTTGFLVVLAAGIGWFMARQALSGLGQVARTARRISGGFLEERVPVKSKGDEIDQLAATFNDMLDRIQTLITGIKDMSNNIAHDLKSPVTRIRGLAEVTLTTGTALEEYQTMAASTIEECDRLLDMINTMLVISEAEAGAEKLELLEMDMAGVVRDACSLFEPMAEDKGLTLTCSVPETCPYYGDIRMMQRMIANLLDNAIKYTSPSGEVSVSVLCDDNEWVVISVKDTGMGISEDDLPHIFERFYRCDPSRSETGTGLGLSLVQAILQAHRGSISVSSDLGKGSTFKVSLPKSPPMGV